jgi:hypothetical protein
VSKTGAIVVIIVVVFVLTSVRGFGKNGLKLLRNVDIFIVAECEKSIFHVVEHSMDFFTFI